LSLFKLLKLHNYAILAWVLLYVLNPFYEYLNIVISHVSITNSLLLITASCQIQLMLYLQQNLQKNNMILVAIIAGVSIASLVLIRPYYLLGGIGLFTYLSYYVYRAKKYKLFIFFILSSLLTLLMTVYIQSVSEAKYKYELTLPVMVEEEMIELDKVQEAKTINNQDQEVKEISNFSKNIGKIIKSDAETQIIKSTTEEEPFKKEPFKKEQVKETKMVLTLKLPSEISHRLDTAFIMLGEASQLLKRIINPEVINPFFKQLLGYMVSPLFIFYMIGLFSIPILKRNGYKIEHLDVIKTLLTIATVVILPLLAFRYLKNTSFTYLVHGITLISLIPVIVMSSIFKKTKSSNKIFQRSLLGFLLIISIQAHIFHTPANYMHNPINNILKSQYAQPGDDTYSIKSAKEVAKIIDSNSIPGDMVLFDQYSPLVFSKAQAVPGLEMSLYDGFFDKHKWINVKTIYKHESNPVARSAKEVLKYIENGDIPLIVYSGRTSKDLIEIIDGVYCPINNYGNYIIYKICEVKDF
jgi:hypothetical protein